MDGKEGIRPNGQPYRVLICDDAESEARTLKQLLEGRGYAIPEVFADGRSLMNWCRKHPGEADLILLDIIMPTLDGFAAFWELKGLESPPRVVFLSQENSSHVITHLINHGAQDYITKPYNRVKLLDRLKSALRGLV